MEKKDDASLAGFLVPRRPTPTHPPYIEMVQNALMKYGGEEGLTAQEINEFLIAIHYDLPPGHDCLFPYYLNLLTQQNAIVQDPSFGRYTIPRRADVERLKSQAEVVLCMLKKAEDQYLKNLAGPFAKQHHLSKIKKLKTLLHEFSAYRAAFEMSHDPDHGGSGPTDEPKGDERPDPNLCPMATGPNRPYEGPRREAPEFPSGSFKIPKSTPALQSEEGRGGSDNPVGNSGPVGSRSGPGEQLQAAPEPNRKPGRWVERKTLSGNVTIRFKLPESGSRSSDEPNNKESANE